MTAWTPDRHAALAWLRDAAAAAERPGRCVRWAAKRVEGGWSLAVWWCVMAPSAR